MINIYEENIATFRAALVIIALTLIYILTH